MTTKHHMRIAVNPEYPEPPLGRRSATHTNNGTMAIRHTATRLLSMAPALPPTYAPKDAEREFHLAGLVK